MSDLAKKHCKPCEGGVAPLTDDQARAMMKGMAPEWTIDGDGKSISRSFSFANYFETMAFVNATAWISHREDHHPDLEVGYSKCLVRYTTHAIGGLSENDFICAAKIDALMSI